MGARFAMASPIVLMPKMTLFIADERNVAGLLQRRV